MGGEVLQILHPEATEGAVAALVQIEDLLPNDLGRPFVGDVIEQLDEGMTQAAVFPAAGGGNYSHGMSLLETGAVADAARQAFFEELGHQRYLLPSSSARAMVFLVCADDCWASRALVIPG
ncbi:hypothetical protein D9M68_851520 [compost metagenome]